MTKEEKIAEAYGEYWERLTDSQKEIALSENGYTQIGYGQEQSKLFLDMKKSGLFDLQPMRPKSLNGFK